MKKIIDNIIYILTAILLTTIVLLKDKYFIMLCLAAGGLIIIGILLFINKNSYALILTPVGICLSISIILYKNFKYPIHKVTLIFFMLSLILIMIFTIIRYFYLLRFNMQTHCLVVEAEITDLIKNPNLEKEVYYPVLTYKKGGEIFDVNCPEGFYKDIPNIGDKMQININPNDYMDVYFKPPISLVIKNVVSSICAIILAIIVLVGTL